LPGTVNDTEGTEQPPPSRAIPYLVVALECDRPMASGARFALDGIEHVTVGRGEVRGATRRKERGIAVLDVRLPAPAMSSSHARWVRAGSAWLVEDNRSTNGTYVNGARVERCIVGAEDLVTVGRTILLLTPPRMTPTDAPRDLDASDAAPVGGQVTLDPELAARLGALDRVARSGIPILLRGETGTGKEITARAVHDASGRRGAFVAVNCGGIPAGLVESHFFGHVRGAFSGAVRDEQGAFRAAAGGTLFLDEIGDLPSASQAALLE
jgi:hypothetical protein